MSNDYYIPFSRYVPIPSLFHSLLADGPFEKCIECEMELLKSTEPYVIERIFRGTEPIVELAVCLACREKISGELSELSRQRIQAFLEERVVWEDRIELLNEEGDDASSWIDRCVINKTLRAECNEYQIVGFCRGDQLALGPLPIMISGHAIEQINRLLSKSTRDRMEDFTDSHFGMPSEFRDLPNTPFII